MDIPQLKKGEITVFSKSGCINCIKVKQFLKEKSIKFIVIECDEFILEDKEESRVLNYGYLQIDESISFYNMLEYIMNHLFYNS